MKRIVKPELLDTLPPGDPRAIRSRRDLRRINWWMRNHIIMTDALESNVSTAPGRITELGAGDGNFMFRLAKKLSPRWPKAGITLLDRQKNISTESVAAIERFGWRAEQVVTDVFDWSSNPAEEIVIANLFLHHFEDGQLAGLLRKVSQNTKLFVAIEPYRFSLPSLFGQLLRLIGCNGVTRHDAVVSIRAGFAGDEISTLWPDKTNWLLTECRAGLFSHLFVARRLV